MTRIRINTQQAREAAQRLYAEADALERVIHSLNHAINSLDTWAWDGRSRAKAEPRLSQVTPAGREVAQALEDLGRKLRRVADTFEQEDAAAAGHLEGMPWVEFETGKGVVLGAMTTFGMVTPTVILASMSAPGVPDFSKMTWAERFACLEQLGAQIPEFEAEQQRLADLIAADDAAILDLDAQIAALQKKRDELQAEADKFGNKLLPSSPLGWGFDDGIIDAPWRTKSDEYEDQVVELERQIEALQNQRIVLQSQRDQRAREQAAVQQQLQSLRAQQAGLNQMVTQGIALDGPSKWHADFPGTTTSNCTKYASLQRNVPCRGNAHQWNEQAVANNYEVGLRPVPGAVMVWEPGVKGGHAEHGHVSVVQRVETLSDGSYKVYYTDNRNHNVQAPSSVVLKPEENGISFIYDEKPQSTQIV